MAQANGRICYEIWNHNTVSLLPHIKHKPVKVIVAQTV